MNENEIITELFRKQDPDYADLQRRILPTVSPDRIIGVRTPELRSFARKLYGTDAADRFLAHLPHRFFEEGQLHAFLISLEKSFNDCIILVDAFLPFVDNWATCDQLLPKVFKKSPESLLPYIHAWIRSDHVYTVRFAIGMLMQHFLDERFSPEYADLVAEVRSGEYYVNMMRAWFFATALAKQYDEILPYLEEKRLDAWTHNKAIQKSIESYRITDAQKQYLRTLKIKKAGT